MKVEPRLLIAVIGANETSSAVLSMAREVGLELGRRGLSLICGGRGGVMEAACAGLVDARDARGTPSLAIGLLPGDDPADANPMLDVVLPTGIGIARNLVIVRSAAAVIAIDGGSGTLSEIAFAWQLGRPIAALESSGGVAAAYAGKAVDPRRADVVMAAATPAEAVELVLQALGRTGGPGTA
jgi:uncharacterized protein (TIGR00725 family)